MAIVRLICPVADEKDAIPLGEFAVAAGRQRAPIAVIRRVFRECTPPRWASNSRSSGPRGNPGRPGGDLAAAVCRPIIPGRSQAGVPLLWRWFSILRVSPAGVAQLVEHHVANVVVVGSNPITRFVPCLGADRAGQDVLVAAWRCRECPALPSCRSPLGRLIGRVAFANDPRSGTVHVSV